MTTGRMSLSILNEDILTFIFLWCFRIVDML